MYLGSLFIFIKIIRGLIYSKTRRLYLIMFYETRITELTSVCAFATLGSSKASTGSGHLQTVWWLMSGDHGKGIGLS